MNILLPEFILIATGTFILLLDLLDLCKKRSPLWPNYLALMGLTVALLSAVFATSTNAEILGGRLALDPLGLYLKEILIFSTLLVLMISPAALQKKAHQQILNLPEFYTILLFTLTGMMILVSSRDLITLYVSLELATIPLFALTAWSKTEKSGEAGFKYLIMGALGSALLLYGFGFLYGLTGTMSLASLQAGLSGLTLGLGSGYTLLVAISLIIAGVGFKLTLFPFHMWAPDAYQGAPTPITAFLSVASKTTGLILAIQLFIKVLGPFLNQGALIIGLLATFTMTLGNLVALRQNNIKRFMAYSSISQAGYILIGFLGTRTEGLTAMVFYILIYALTNLAAFGVLMIHIHQTGREDIESLKGMSQTDPILALALMIALFGLAGIPPLSGFVGKFFLFSMAAQQGYYWLVAVAAINSTVSLYYYLRLVKQMYIEPPDTDALTLQTSTLTRVGLGIATVGSVLVGLTPIIYETLQSASVEWLK